MLKYFCVFLLCFYVCSANELIESERKKGGGLLLYGGGLLYYFTFLLVKIKVIAVVGTLITLALVAGKIYAFYKYMAYLESHTPHHTEPIYSDSPPITPYFSKDVYLDHSPYELDHNPHDHHHESYHGSDHESYQDSPPPDASHDKVYNSKIYARKIDSIENVVDMTSKIFKGLNLSELAFDAMKIKSEECKKKFLCEAYAHAEHNRILSLGLSILNDVSQEKYVSWKNTLKLDECRMTFQECENSVRNL